MVEVVVVIVIINKVDEIYVFQMLYNIKTL